MCEVKANGNCIRLLAPEQEVAQRLVLVTNIHSAKPSTVVVTMVQTPEVTMLPTIMVDEAEESGGRRNKHKPTNGISATSWCMTCAILSTLTVSVNVVSQLLLVHRLLPFIV
jgi:hypothetical protein